MGVAVSWCDVHGILLQNFVFLLRFLRWAHLFPMICLISTAVRYSSLIWLRADPWKTGDVPGFRRGLRLAGGIRCLLETEDPVPEFRACIGNRFPNFS